MLMLKWVKPYGAVWLSPQENKLYINSYYKIVWLVHHQYLLYLSWCAFFIVLCSSIICTSGAGAMQFHTRTYNVHFLALHSPHDVARIYIESFLIHEVN